jgi:hypothetical protein
MSTHGENPNILLCIVDDWGQDSVEVGRLFLSQQNVAMRSIIPKQIRVVTNDGTVQITGALPNLSLLLRNGVYFQQAWAQPSCSPTRASIYTGLHPWKSGVGSPINPQLDPLFSSTTLPTLLPRKYVSGLFGKWHLGEQVLMRPTDHGWDKHVGTLNGVLDDGIPPDPPGYTNWKIVDSDNGYTPAPTTDYATRRTVKEAGAWINAQDPATPWFVTIAFHTPHDPFHIPPYGYDTATAGYSNPPTDDYMFNVMTQNMETNIGRLLGIVGGGGPAALDFEPISQGQLRNTVIIFMGDNGSPTEVATQEEKTYVYEGSVRVPLIIADGQAVVNEINSEAIAPRFLHLSKLDTENHLMVHAVDLYKTIAGLANSSSSFPSNTDSWSLLNMLGSWPLVQARLPQVDPNPLELFRPYNFSQWYTTGQNIQKRATIRNNSYKLNYDDAASPPYSLYRYVDGEIPGREDDGTADNLYDDARSGADQDALDNLNVLFDELINHYQPNETDSFPPLPPFP